jgi:hypothetical protein
MYALDKYTLDKYTLDKYALDKYTLDKYTLYLILHKESNKPDDRKTSAT